MTDLAATEWDPADCPEHTEPRCPVCLWLATRTCGCPKGMFCLRCNRVVMDEMIRRKNNG